MTARDEQVLRLIAKGKIAKEVAQELGISEHSVEYHLLAARKCLGAKNTVEAVSKYLQLKPAKRKAVSDRTSAGLQTLLLDAAKLVG